MAGIWLPQDDNLFERLLHDPDRLSDGARGLS